MQSFQSVRLGFLHILALAVPTAQALSVRSPSFFSMGDDVDTYSQPYVASIPAGANAVVGSIPAGANAVVGSIPAGANAVVGSIPAGASVVVGSIPAGANAIVAGAKSVLPLAAALSNSTKTYKGQTQEAHIPGIIALGCFIGFVLLILGGCSAFGTWEICRLIPFWHSVGFGISIVGVALAETAASIFKKAVSQINLRGSHMDISGMSYWLTFSFVVMLIINSVSLWIGLIGNGCIREALFDNRYHRNEYKNSLQCMQCLLGSALINIDRFFLWITVFVQMAFSYIYLEVFIVCKLLSAACGDQGSNFTSLVDSVNKLMRTAGIGKIDTKFIVDYCNISYDVSQAGLLLFIGCVITVVSQIIMLTALAAEQERIKNERKAVSKDLYMDNVVDFPSNASLGSGSFAPAATRSFNRPEWDTDYDYQAGPLKSRNCC